MFSFDNNLNEKYLKNNGNHFFKSGALILSCIESEKAVNDITDL
jgi:hypothetical protein